MDGFEKSLEDLLAEMRALSHRSEELTEMISRIILEHDGECSGLHRRFRTLNASMESVIRETEKRLERFRAGDLPELPPVLELAIECCERLNDTAEMYSGGKSDCRRDLKGQISANTVYLAHHLRSMKEDGYMPDDAPDFEELLAFADRIARKETCLDELVDFARTGIRPVHEYLNGIRGNLFWEPDD